MVILRFNHVLYFHVPDWGIIMDIMVAGFWVLVKIHMNFYCLRNRKLAKVSLTIGFSPPRGYHREFLQNLRGEIYEKMN